MAELLLMAGASSETFEWFYIGHYGQLGPLSLGQMKDLICDGVIEKDTYVWRNGMPEWVMAKNTAELEPTLTKFQSTVPPPPPDFNPRPTMTPPAPRVASPEPPAYQVPPPQSAFSSMNSAFPAYDPYHSRTQLSHLPQSDKSRVVAGVLQLIFPGVGRMYLGYVVFGFFQLFLSFCGFGYIWSIIDGILILMGQVKLDGYGRRIPD